MRMSDRRIIPDDCCRLIPVDDAISLVNISSNSHPLSTSIGKDFPGCALMVEPNGKPGTWNADSDIAPNVLFQGVAEGIPACSAAS